MKTSNGVNQEKDLAISLPLQISDLIKGLVFAGASILSFFVPFSLGHPQWLVGTIVNACLFLSAIYLPKRYFIPLAILPSLGILARGLVFGPFTLFLVYFLPFIWIGNLVLILTFSRLAGSRYAGKNNFGYIFSGILASIAKFLFLLIIANIYFKFSIVPALFLQSMGFNQLATALAGGLVAFVIFYFYGKLNAGSRRTN